MTYHAMAEDLRYFIERHEIKNASVVGHSMGGKTAMVTALRFPELITRLTILDIAPVVYDHSHTPHINAMRGIDLAQVKNRSSADAMLKPDIPETGIRQFLLQNLVYKNGSYSWRINLEVLDNAMDDLTGFPTLQNNPVYTRDSLFLYGGQSDYVQPSTRQRIKDLFPNSTMQTIENAGHWLHAEQPTLVGEIVREFLSSGESSST